MKTYECDKIRLEQVVLQMSGEDWILIINYAVGIGDFDSIKRYSKSFVLSPEEQTSIKNFLSSKIDEIKTQEEITEIIY